MIENIGLFQCSLLFLFNFRRYRSWHCSVQVASTYRRAFLQKRLRCRLCRRIYYTRSYLRIMFACAPSRSCFDKLSTNGSVSRPKIFPFVLSLSKGDGKIRKRGSAQYICYVTLPDLRIGSCKKILFIIQPTQDRLEWRSALNRQYHVY